jgi:hypothetical protein
MTTIYPENSQACARLRIPFFWDMTLSQWVTGSHSLEGTYCLRLQKTVKSLKNSSETDYPVTLRQIREERNPRLHRCENLETRNTRIKTKSYCVRIKYAG